MITPLAAPILSAWPTARGSLPRSVLLALLGTLLLWVSAKVQVPFWPVPMTMQTAVVLLIGAVYGPSLGAATVGVYLLEGALGLPVLAGTPERGSGLPYMLGPTGGYLAGFVLAAAVAGWTVGRTRRPLAVLAGMAAGLIAANGLGFAWLATLIGAAKAFNAGVLPFLLGESVKAALVTGTVLALDACVRSQD
ncbi:MAG: biotin transporter BioY [Geminicoccaceae bacterium]|jgi:biotin transport system substrate-specific component